MAHDIDIIKERVHAMFPDVTIEQLRVTYPGVDDDGVWFFRCDGIKGEVQLESSTQDVPFLIETSTSPKRITAATIEEAVEALRVFFSGYC